MSTTVAVTLPFGTGQWVGNAFASGVNITQGCTWTAVSSDPTLVTVGTPNFPAGGNGEVIPYSVIGAGAATITITATDAAGSLSEVYTATLQMGSPDTVTGSFSTATS